MSTKTKTTTNPIIDGVEITPELIEVIKSIQNTFPTFKERHKSTLRMFSHIGQEALDKLNSGEKYNMYAAANREDIWLFELMSNLLMEISENRNQLFI